jgi:hypothetical protein
MGPLLGYGELIAKQDEFLHKGDIEGHHRFVDSVVDKGEPPELRTQYLINRLWQQTVRNVMNELIRSPITQGPSGVRPIDVSTSLQQLPLRQAYVRIGTEPHVMQTEPLTAGVEAEEEEERRLQLQEQTRQTLCRHISTEQRIHEKTPATSPLEPVQHDEKAVTSAPLLKRSRPLE